MEFDLLELEITEPTEAEEEEEEEEEENDTEENWRAPKLYSIPVRESTWDWFEWDDLPDMNWVVPALGICPGPITLLSGFSGTGKTIFAANLALCITNNLPFLGCSITTPGKVLHLDFEFGEMGPKIYYGKVARGLGLTSFKGLFFDRPAWRLDDTGARAAIMDLISGKDYKLCIIDCFTAALKDPCLNEDRIRAPLDMLTGVSEETGCSFLVVHHEPKAEVSGRNPLKSVKGSGAIIAAAGGSIHLSKVTYNSKEITMTLGKTRLVAPLEIGYRLSNEGVWIPKINGNDMVKLVPSPPLEPCDPREIILALLKEQGGLSTRALEHQTGELVREKNNKIGTPALRKLISEMVSEGTILLKKDGQSNLYSLPASVI